MTNRVTKYGNATITFSLHFDGVLLKEMSDGVETYATRAQAVAAYGEPYIDGVEAALFDLYKHELGDYPDPEEEPSIEYLLFHHGVC